MLFLLGAAVAAHGATYYIDFTSGSDTNNGTSVSTPLKHCPGDVNATNVAASTTLTGGDTAIFKGAVTYISPSAGITVASGTSSTSRVLYDGNTAGTFGVGRAVISGPVDGNGNGVNNSVGFNAVSKNYFTVENFEFYRLGSYQNFLSYDCSSLPPSIVGTGIYLKQVSYATIQNNYFHEIGEWQNTSPLRGDADVSGYGVKVDSGNNLSITGNEFTKMSYGVYLFVYNSSPLNISQVTVSGNNLHNYMRWPVSGGVNGDGATFQDVSIYNNAIHDYTEYDTGASNSFCSSVPHTDGIILFIGGIPYRNSTLGTSAHPIRIYANSFYQNATTGGGTAYIFLTGWGGTTYVYNNTFVNSHPSGGGEGSLYVQDGTRASDNNPALDYHFCNNTFYDGTYEIFLRSVTSSYELNRTGNVLDIENNIFYQTDNGGGGITSVVSYDDNHNNVGITSLPTTLDYNLYYTPNQSGHYAFQTHTTQGITDYSWSELQQYHSFEAHGGYADPKFAALSGLGLNSSSNDLRLQGLSPAISAGANLYSAFTADAAGNPRPVSGAWSMGAYQAQQRPNPPLSLTVTSIH
jgi:hypothetical protein